MTETIQEQESVAREIRTAVRHSAVYGLGAMLAKALGFFMLPVYTRYLNPLDYGTLEILDLSISLLGMFLNMGMTAALLRYYATAKSDAERRTVVSTALLFVVGTGLVILALALGFARPISAMLVGPKIPVTYFLLSFSSFILGYVVNVPRTYLRALEASGTFVLLDTVGLFLLLLLNIIFVVVFKVGLAGILLSVLLINLGWTGSLIWTVCRVGLGFSRSLLRQMVAFGMPLVFANVALFGLNFSDRFFLKHFQSLDAVGIYAVGYKFGFMLNYLLIQPFNAMWQARMYVIHAQPDHPKIFGRMFVLYSLLLTYVGLSVSVLSPEIVHVMVGPKFAQSQGVIAPVVLAYIFYGLANYVQLGLFLTKNTNTIGTISIAGAVLNLVLNYFLIYRYGMVGAAWATVAGFLAVAAGSYWCSQRVLPIPLGARRIGIAMMTAAGIYIISRWLHPESFGGSLAVKGVLLSIFPLLLWKSGIISQSEIGIITSIADSAGQRVRRMLGVAAGTVGL